MTDVEPVVTDFAASGRAGRRNALPDILGSPAGAGTSDLPPKLAELSVSEDGPAARSSDGVSAAKGKASLCSDAGAEGGEVSSSKALLESQEAEGKHNDS